MDLIIRYNSRDLKNYFVVNLFKNLIDELRKSYPEHNFSIVHDKSFEKFGYGSIYSCMNLSILNPENDNYILVSLFDNWRYHFMKHLGWAPKKMKQFFYAGGFNYFDFYYFNNINQSNLDIEIPDNFDSIYTQFFYNPYYNNYDTDIKNVFEYNPKKINSLFFRGWMWDFRKNMVQNLNRSDVVIVDKNQSNQNLSFLDYLKELKNYKAALSLPGGTEICNRDIECFSIGVPVIRPTLHINYPEPLVANYHYISCYHACDYSDDGYPKYLNYEDFKTNLTYVWDKVKNNNEYLDFISKNAKDWYEKNCKMESNLNFLIKNIDLSKL
jgi:hypothetical protein